MAKHLDSGKLGEQLAIDFLKQAGYSIVAINWRYKYWEVDVIAMDSDILSFIEVKSRSGVGFGEPIDFVDSKKQKNLMQAAEAYLEISGYEGEIRFDIVSVYLEENKVELIKDAFWSN